MFEDWKGKTENWKKAAESKAKDLSEIKASIENSKTRLVNSAQKTSAVLGETGSRAKTAILSGKDATDEVINKHWPAIEGVLIHGLIGLAEEKLNDEKFLRSTLEGIFEILPSPVRVVIGRDKFLAFCIRRKEPILLHIREYKANKIGSSEISGTQLINHNHDKS